MIAMSNPILTEKTLVRLGVNDLGCAVKVDHSSSLQISRGSCDLLDDDNPRAVRLQCLQMPSAEWSVTLRSQKCSRSLTGWDM